MSKLCSRCQKANSASARFCAHCGAPLTAAPPAVHCPACGATSSPGGKFCDACGAALPALGTTNSFIPAVPETEEISESLEGRPWSGPGIDSAPTYGVKPGGSQLAPTWWVRLWFFVFIIFTCVWTVGLLSALAHSGVINLGKEATLIIPVFFGLIVMFERLWTWKRRSAKGNILRRTPLITKLIDRVERSMVEGTKGGAGRGHLVGEARNVTMRQEFTRSMQEYTIWSFRLVRYDAAGNRLDPIAVELRGLGITGTIAEGDRVEVIGKPPRDAPLQVKTVYNLSTNSRVSARIPISYRIGKVIQWVIFLAVIGVVAIFVVAIISGGGR